MYEGLLIDLNWVMLIQYRATAIWVECGEDVPRRIFNGLARQCQTPSMSCRHMYAKVVLGLEFSLPTGLCPQIMFAFNSHHLW